MRSAQSLSYLWLTLVLNTQNAGSAAGLPSPLDPIVGPQERR